MVPAYQTKIELSVIFSAGKQTSFFQGTSPSFTVGSSEEELKETFLTTGIFQRKPGDSLDGRRSFKRFRRQAERRSYGDGGGSYEQQQDCQSVASEQCRESPRKKCSTDNQNCQMRPREVCRTVPRWEQENSSIPPSNFPLQKHLYDHSEAVVSELSQNNLSGSSEVAVSDSSQGRLHLIHPGK